MQLQDKVALVTGASRGIGAAIAVGLARAGCDVACAARATDASPMRTPGTLDETVARIEAEGRRGLAIPTNLAVEDEVSAMVHTAIEHFGRVDVLVNNAGVTFFGELDVSLSRWDLTMAINTRAPLVAIREASAAMRETGGGAIITVSSLAAVLPQPNTLAYGVAKAALERLSVDAAQILAPVGIAVNCLRIDVPVASEGFVANMPETDTTGWESTTGAAEAVLWMLTRPEDYTAQIESLHALRDRGVLPSAVGTPSDPRPPLALVTGIVDPTKSGVPTPGPA